MYTQCPYCSESFRVTADVLRVASGKVRCGGCGAAFNALDHLSEHRPETKQPSAPPPELAPETASQSPMPPAAEGPAAREALLSDFREGDAQLEDTGIEPQLVDEGRQGIPGNGRDTLLDADLSADLAVSKVDEVLSSSGTEIDEVLLAETSAQTDTPIDEFFLDADSSQSGTPIDELFLNADTSQSDSPIDEVLVDDVSSQSDTPVDEWLADGGETAVESAEVFAPGAAKPLPDDELRFDDNTGLPDDYDDDDELTDDIETPVPEPVIDALEPVGSLDVEIELGDPDEWQDILAEVGPEEEEEEDADESGQQAGAALFDPAIDPVETGTEVRQASEPYASEPYESGEPGETGAGETEGMTLAEELEALEVDLDDDDAETPDADELTSQMEALSLELSGLQEELDVLSEQSTPPTLADELEQLELVADNEPFSDEVDEAASGTAPPDENPVDAIIDSSGKDRASDDEPAQEDADNRILGTPDADIELEGLLAADGDNGDNGEPATTEPQDASIDDDLIAAAFETEAAEAEGLASTSGSFTPPVVEPPAEHVVPPPTEEEETINRLIDQDLMALAIEDEDGMTSTIAADGGDDEDGRDDNASSGGFSLHDFLPEDGSVETIVMEGSSARSGDDVEEQAEQDEARKAEAQALLAARDEEAGSTDRPRDWRKIAGAAALAVLLSLQLVHFSRHALATVPAFNSILAPVYSALGMPLVPAWNVTAWRFEATRGSTDESGETLTIYSRIGNNSTEDLPYPVLSVALTDRFEEPIGSRVLEPAEYLTDNLDTNRLVPAGTTFNALIAIDSPADEAMGFKLNVCYRVGGDRLRCAIEDFKD